MVTMHMLQDRFEAFLGELEKQRKAKIEEVIVSSPLQNMVLTVEKETPHSGQLLQRPKKSPCLAVV